MPVLALFLDKMSIAQLRRKLNDSRIGRAINSSVPGILFEGFCRELSDRLVNGAGYRNICSISHNNLGEFYTYCDISLKLSELNASKRVSPERHYSHTSPLWKREIGKDGTEYFTGVALSEALR